MASALPIRYCTGCRTRLARDNTGPRCAACGRSGRGTLLQPPEVPSDFWAANYMRDALATWHMGRVLFAYRTHPWHAQPLSQGKVGSWLGLTQAQLSRIENGRAPEELTKLIRYAQILGIPGSLLWFKLPDETAAAPIRLPVLLNGRSVLLPIDLDAAHADGLGGLLDELTGGEQQSHPSAHALPGTDIDELEHVAAALDDARRYLDGSVVGHFRQQLDHGKIADGDRGPIKALPLVLGILGAISQHVRDVQPAVRTSLLSLGADGAEFAGWLYRDLQDHLFERFMAPARAAIAPQEWDAELTAGRALSQQQAVALLVSAFPARGALP